MAPDVNIERLRFLHIFGLRLTPKLPAILDDTVTLASEAFGTEPVL